MFCLEVGKSNVFETVKQSVTTRQAAEFYGIPVGRNGMACCPFHDDRHPSMKVDRRFHCFACQGDGDDDDKIRLNQRKPSKYKGLRRFGPEKNLQRINKFMKERPIFYKNLIQMKENIRFYLRCFYCITKVMILQFNSENRTELARNG